MTLGQLIPNDSKVKQMLHTITFNRKTTKFTFQNKLKASNKFNCMHQFNLNYIKKDAHMKT